MQPGKGGGGIYRHAGRHPQGFGLLGLSELARLPDYVLMGLDLLTDDEYASAG